jgi:hypothetical protein
MSTLSDRVLGTPPTNSSKIPSPPTGFLNAVARIHLSHLMRDPFVRDAFERAEHDGGDSEGAFVSEDHPKTLDGGAAEVIGPPAGAFWRWWRADP